MFKDIKYGQLCPVLSVLINLVKVYQIKVYSSLCQVWSNVAKESR